MELLTKELKARFRQVGRQEEVDDPLVIAKFFNPVGQTIWLATEFEEESGLFFGYASLFNDWNNEWGYFSLAELEALKLPFGFRVERDRHFEEAPFRTVADREGIYYRRPQEDPQSSN